MWALEDAIDDFLLDRRRRGWDFDAVDMVNEIDELDGDLKVAENVIRELEDEGRIEYVGDFTGDRSVRPHYRVVG